jgi:hypothetical protein
MIQGLGMRYFILMYILLLILFLIELNPVSSVLHIHLMRTDYNTPGQFF